jgi:hypothetical protein
MKIKVGTQLDDEVFRRLKIAAAQEKRPVSEVIQAALCDYLYRKKRRLGQGSGLRRFLDSPAFTLTDAQLRETMEADYYDQ